MGGRPDQGRAANHHRAGLISRQPGQDLEHRRGGPVCHRGANRSGRRLRPARRACLHRDSRHDRGGHSRRHGLGRRAGASEDAVSRLGSAVHADARLCRDAGAELPDRRPVEGPERAQLPPDAAVHSGADIAQRHPRHSRPSGLRRRYRADPDLLAPPSAVGVRLLGAHGRRRAERRALRRLRRLAHGVVDLDDQRRHGRPRRHPRGDEPARPDQPRFPLRLRLHRHHRLVPRPAASGRRLLRRPHPRGDLCRRTGRPDGGSCARGDRRHLPGDHAVLHPGKRHPRPLSAANRPRRAARRRRGSAGVTLDFIIDAIVTVIGVTTPILLAATGELIVEKSGVLNLGVEGMMLVGAVTGFAVTLNSGDALGDWAPWVGVVAAAVAGAASSMLFAFLVLTLASNQVATGLALAIFGIGLSSLVGAGYVGMVIPPFNQVFPDWLATDPIGRVVFGYSPLVYFALIMVFAVGWFMNRTRAGLILRAVGENDISAHSIGYPVIAIRYAAVAFGGALAGIGGSYFSMVITPMWAEQMTAGRGWIALALVVFSSWRAGRLLLGAYFFGILMTLELYAKASGYSFLPSQFWAAMPYIMAVAVLAVMSARGVTGSEAPACLGRPFMPNS